MATFRAKPMSRSLRIYQKAAIVFVVISLLLLLGVLYLSISQATIKVVPTEGVVSATSAVEVAKDAGLGQVEGAVFMQSFSKAKTFALPEDGATAVEEKAGGVVTLINETDSSQDLVASTRLLSEEGILFRLDEAVSVPANGQIDAIVHADEAGLSGEIGPTQFTIPGLSTSLQSVIYAVSVDSMVGGVQYVRTLAQSDLDQAVDELKQEILDESKEVFMDELGSENIDGEAFLVDVTERVSDTEPGTETGSFTISLTVDVTAVFYEKEKVAQYMEVELYNQLQESYEVVSINSDGLTAEVQSVNQERKTATLEVYMDGLAVITSSSDVLHKDRLTGKSATEVITLLKGSDAIQDVSVEFTPFWLKRVPALEDHIKIIIVQ